MFDFLSGGSTSTSWIFLIIIIGIVIFIVYSGFKKKKKEKQEQNKRELEVKKEIKKYLLENKKLKNVSVHFVKVLSRYGKIYKYRDVFDVFVEVKNNKKNQIIKKYAFEIEGIATYTDKKKSNKEYEVKWFINKEFDDYDKHLELIEKTPNTKWKIYLRSFKIKNLKERKKYKKEQIQKIKNWKKEQELRHKNINKKEEKTKDVFRPEVKKRDEK